MPYLKKIPQDIVLRYPPLLQQLSLPAFKEIQPELLVYKNALLEKEQKWLLEWIDKEGSDDHLEELTKK
jgi:hypothetical protein